MEVVFYFVNINKATKIVTNKIALNVQMMDFFRLPD